jgi:hypothetical protein
MLETNCEAVARHRMTYHVASVVGSAVELFSDLHRNRIDVHPVIAGSQRPDGEVLTLAGEWDRVCRTTLRISRVGAWAMLGTTYKLHIVACYMQ